MAKIDFTNGAAPVAPAAGKVSLYTKTDKKIYIKDDAGLETNLATDLDTGITQLTGDVTAGPGNGSQAATIANGAVTNAKVATGIDAVKLADGSVSNAEFQFINSLTSNAQTQLDAKVDENAAIVGATNTKITYDAKGLVTAGTAATTVDINDSLNRRYVTDAQLVVVGNTSGTNTGDQNLTGLVPYVGAAADINLGNTQKIVNCQDPSLAQDVATKNYVDTYTGFVPYTGATGNISLGTNKYIGIAGTFERLENSFGDTVFDLDLRRGLDTTNTLSIDIALRTLTSAATFTTFDWSSGIMNRPSSGQLVADFESRLLACATSYTLDWGSCALYDEAGIKSAQWSTSQRQLFDFGGSYPSVDFGNYGLYNIGISNSVPLLSWNISEGGSVKIYYGYTNAVVGDFTNGQLLAPGSSALTLDWNNYLLYDNFNSICVDWNYHTLQFLGATTLNWETTALFDTSGNLTIAWGSRQLIDSGSSVVCNWNSKEFYRTTGSTSIDWNGSYLRDTSSVRALDWAARGLYSSTNTLMASWASAGTFQISAAATSIPLGTAAIPSLTFTGDANTGMYSPAADQIGFTGGGVVRFQIFTAGVESAAQVRGAAGSAGTPTFVPSNDTNTGMFGAGADILGFSTGGTERMRIDASGDITLSDGTDFILNATTGTKVGTATGQKLSFHNSTPVIQRAGAAQVAVAVTAATNVAPFGFTTAAQADAIVTLVNEIRAALVEKGLIKGSS